MDAMLPFSAIVLLEIFTARRAVMLRRHRRLFEVQRLIEVA